jgi:hypothetical protein
MAGFFAYCGWVGGGRDYASFVFVVGLQIL